ncbi:hypothetical protein C6501_05185 [Candidatus Poribacteria bacterium]|nr:MAG: hypothetical protein C6501_05185 [Candidatus Poribacteria bacterium]
MYKKMLWGLGVLVLLICTAFVFMTVRNRAEIRQLKKEYAVTEKPLEARDEPTQPITDNKPHRPARAGFKWEWHGDHWHEIPVAQADDQEVVVPVKKMTDAQKAEWEKYWKDQGLEPPPPGYTYVWNDTSAKLVQFNVPYFEVTDTYGYNNYYQLSDNEWDRYKALSAIAHKSLNRVKIPDDVASLAKKWLEPLHQKTWGLQKAIVTTVTYDREETPEDVAYNQKLTSEKLAAIKPPEVDYSINHDVVDLIILELEEALQRR